MSIKVESRERGQQEKQLLSLISCSECAVMRPWLCQHTTGYCVKICCANRRSIATLRSTLRNRSNALEQAEIQTCNEHENREVSQVQMSSTAEIRQDRSVFSLVSRRSPSSSDRIADKDCLQCAGSWDIDKDRSHARFLYK